jgi:hypothetical protein
MHNSRCGWCGQTGHCIAGNINGPLAPCLRSTFLYTAPTPEWNPMKAGHINILAIDKRGIPQNHIVPEPNFNKIDSYNPYH